MRRSDDRFLTTHTGSLPRPSALVALFAARVNGESIDPERLRALALEATQAAIAAQLESGVDIGNNGEQDREGFFLYVQHRMTGFGGRWTRYPRQDFVRYPEYSERFTALAAAKTAVTNFDPPTAIGEVKYIDKRFVVEECETFQRLLDQSADKFTEAFVTAPSPGIVASAMKNLYYDSQSAYLAAIAAGLRIEYQTIVQHGFLLQLDCPDLALERHLSYQDRPIGEFLAFVEEVVEALNRALEGIPRDRVRLHVCWGNYEGPHDCDVPLADILPILLEANVGSLVLPFANPRHAHEYHLLKTHRLGDDQVLVAGVIDPLTAFVEHPDVVAERIERVAQAVGEPERVIAGTDCGFDTSAGMGRITADVVWAKMKAMREGADRATERLLR
ncbi:MAG: cobalamin-independent methionine synthase II family protein [Pseudomonadota bacterium]